MFVAMKIVDGRKRHHDSCTYLHQSSRYLKNKNKNKKPYKKNRKLAFCEPPSWNMTFLLGHPENIDNHRIWGGGGAGSDPGSGPGYFLRFPAGEGGGDRPSFRLRKETISLLLMFRPSKLPCNLGIAFVEPWSDKLFRPPLRRKKDHSRWEMSLIYN